jgi:predicted AAA+ superfamily ATPase
MVWLFPQRDGARRMPEGLIARHLQGEIEDALLSARIVNVIGPRQVGKTILVRDLLDGGRFITLDDVAVLTALDADPYGHLIALCLESQARPVIIDEAQRSRHLALAIKRIVDERRDPGQFLLTGSSNVFAAAHVTDSLAGRVQVLTLHPLSAAEIHGSGPALLLDWASNNPSAMTLPPLPQAGRADYINLILRGGYPEIRRLNVRARTRRYRDAIDAIVDRDVADVLKVRKSDALRRLIDQVASRTANELNIDALCSDVGVRRETMMSYLDALTRLSLVARLGAWAKGSAKREIKRPKLHLLDTGIIAALRGLNESSFAVDADPTSLGHILESYVYGEIVRNLPYQASEWRLYHWRDEKGREIDILAECDRTLVAMEVKAAATIVPDDLYNLVWFKTEGPGKDRKVVGVIFYLGDQVLTLGNSVFALPLSILWAYGRSVRSP